MNNQAKLFLKAFESYKKANQERFLAEEEMWESLKKLRRFFDKREYKIAKLRFINHKTLEEVGKEFGVTRERIRLLEEKMLEKIKVLTYGLPR